MWETGAGQPGLLEYEAPKTNQRMNETKCKDRVHIFSSFKRWDGREGLKQRKGHFLSVFRQLEDSEIQER